MATWRWAVGTLANGPTRELSTAYGRRLTWRVDAACDAQFTLDGDGSEIQAITQLASDLWVWRNGTHVFRGRIGGWQGTLNQGGHSVTFSAVDYRAMLNRRMVGATGAAFTNTDQAVIAWNLIAGSQALPGGNWTITNGLGPTSTQNRDATYDPGKPLGDAIGELGRLANGFEWEISPTLQLNRWYPRRGVDTALKLDYGGVLVDVGYSADSATFGNAVLVTGDQTTTPVAAADTGIATDLRGRWELSQSFPTVSVQQTLADRAPWLLGQVDSVRPEYRVTLRPGRWTGPSMLWTGDIVYPSIKHGWLVENGRTPYRAVEIQIVLDGHGQEEIQLGLLAAVGPGGGSGAPPDPPPLPGPVPVPPPFPTPPPPPVAQAIAAQVALLTFFGVQGGVIGGATAFNYYTDRPFAPADAAITTIARQVATLTLVGVPGVLSTTAGGVSTFNYYTDRPFAPAIPTGTIPSQPATLTLTARPGVISTTSGGTFNYFTDRPFAP